MLKTYPIGDLSKDGQSLTQVGSSKPEQIISNNLPDLMHEPIQITSGSEKKQIALYTGMVQNFENMISRVKTSSAKIEPIIQGASM